MQTIHQFDEIGTPPELGFTVAFTSDQLCGESTHIFGRGDKVYEVCIHVSEIVPHKEIDLCGRAPELLQCRCHHG